MVLVGGSFNVIGSGFTAGSVITFFVATPNGPVNEGPLTPNLPTSGFQQALTLRSRGLRGIAGTNRGPRGVKISEIFDDEPVAHRRGASFFSARDGWLATGLFGGGADATVKGVSALGAGAPAPPSAAAGCILPVTSQPEPAGSFWVWCIFSSVHQPLQAKGVAPRSLPLQ